MSLTTNPKHAGPRRLASASTDGAPLPSEKAPEPIEAAPAAPTINDYQNEDDAIRINLDFLADLNEADFDQFDRIMTALVGRTGIHPVELAAIRYGDLHGHHYSPRLEEALSGGEWLPPVAASWFERGEKPTLVRLEAWGLGPRRSIDWLCPKESLHRRAYQRLQRNVDFGENEPGADEGWREGAYDPFKDHGCEKDVRPEVALRERLANVPAPPVVWAALELLAGGVPKTGMPVEMDDPIVPTLEPTGSFNDLSGTLHPDLVDAAERGDPEAKRQVYVIALNECIIALCGERNLGTRAWGKVEGVLVDELRALLKAYADAAPTAAPTSNRDAEVFGTPVRKAAPGA